MGFLGEVGELITEVGKLTGEIIKSRSTYEDLSRLAAATGKDQILSNGTFIQQFKDTGVTFGQATEIYRQSLRIGLDTNKGNMLLLTDIQRLGLNVGAFSEIMAISNQIYGLNTEASQEYSKAIISTGRQYGIHADSLVGFMQKLQPTLDSLSVQFSGKAYEAVSEAALTLTGALGPKAGGGIADLLAKITGTDSQSFGRLAMIGADPGAMGRAAAGGNSQETLRTVVDIAQRTLGLAEQYGVGSANSDPRMLSEFQKITGFSARDLQISRLILEVSRNGFEDLNRIGMEESRKQQQSRDLSEAFNNVIFSIQERLYSFFQGLAGGVTGFASNLTTIVESVLNSIGLSNDNLMAMGKSIGEFLSSDEILKYYGMMADGFRHYVVDEAIKGKLIPAMEVTKKVSSMLWTNVTENLIPAFNKLSRFLNAMYDTPMVQYFINRSPTREELLERDPLNQQLRLLNDPNRAVPEPLSNSEFLKSMEGSVMLSDPEMPIWGI
jgi:hypothetical protein